MGLFYDYIKQERSIYRAWQHVHASARSSSNEKTQDQLKKLEERLTSVVRGISGRLARRSYTFSKADGILKDKTKRERAGKNPRPIVVQLVVDRIVQRAILDALQPRSDERRYNQLGRIKDVNESFYSIGGVVGGGVEAGLSKITNAIRDGYCYFYKSDISSFFTRIPHRLVCDFISVQTNDHDLAAFFEQAINVELENKEILGSYFDLFPHSGIGFAQGSSLSAFAGNILLNDFDNAMNSGDVRMFRYIDDILILGKRNEDVQSAKSVAKYHLRRFNMGLYAPGGDKKKADEGHVRNGVLHLGCLICGIQVEPDKDAKQRIIAKIQQTIDKAKESISAFSKTDACRSSRELAYYQALARIDRQVHGWGNSYRFISSRLCFSQLDKEIDQILSNFEQWFFSHISYVDHKKKRRIQGITLLQDITLSERRDGLIAGAE